MNGAILNKYFWTAATIILIRILKGGRSYFLNIINMLIKIPSVMKCKKIRKKRNE